MDAIEQPEHRFCAECGRPTLPDELASFGGHMVCPECKNTYVQKLREGVAPGMQAFHFGGFWIRFVAAMIDGIILAVVAGIGTAPSRVRPSTAPVPATMPAVASHVLSRKIIPRTCAGCAPSARRMPISLRRLATEYAMIP